MIATEVPSQIKTPDANGMFVRTRLIWLFYVLAGLCSFVPSSLGPLMPFLRSELNFSYTVSAFHFSGFALGVLIAGSFGERVMALRGRRAALWGGLIGVASGILVLVCGRDAVVTVFGVWLIGLCMSLVGQTIDTVIAEQFGEQRTIAITETNIVTSICSMAAPAAVGLFVTIGLTWRAPLLLLIGLFGASAWFFRTVVIPGRFSVDRNDHSGKLTQAYWAYWLVILLGCASEWSIVFWSADFLEKVAKLSKPDAAAAVSAFFMAMMASRILGSRLARHIHIRVLLPVAAIVSIAGFFVFWLAPSAPLNIAGLFLAGLGVANMYPLTLSAALGVVPNQVGLAASRMNMATGSAGLFAPLLLGSVAERAGIQVAYGVVAILLSLAVGSIFWANRLARKYDEQGTMFVQ